MKWKPIKEFKNEPDSASPFLFKMYRFGKIYDPCPSLALAVKSPHLDTGYVNYLGKQKDMKPLFYFPISALEGGDPHA